jgi:hypothetical protein
MRKENYKKSCFYLFISLFVMACFLGLPSSLQAETNSNSDKGFFVDLSLNYFFPSDADFKDIYKESLMIPFIGAGYHFSRNFYIFGGFEFYSIEGKTPVWDFNTKMTQNVISFGGGYFKDLSEKVGISGELGLVFINYTEEITDLNLENKDNCMGFRLGTKLQYQLSDLISLALKIGYTIAKDTIDDFTTNFGGLHTGLGLLFIF